MADKSTTGGPVTMLPPSEKLSDRERYADLRTSGDRPGETLSFEMGTEDDQIFSLREIDPVLDAKMRLINKVQRAPIQVYKNNPRLIHLLCRPWTKSGGQTCTLSCFS